MLDMARCAQDAERRARGRQTAFERSRSFATGGIAGFGVYGDCGRKSDAESRAGMVIAVTASAEGVAFGVPNATERLIAASARGEDTELLAYTDYARIGVAQFLCSESMS